MPLLVERVSKCWSGIWKEEVGRELEKQDGTGATKKARATCSKNEGQRKVGEPNRTTSKGKAEK